MSPTEDTDNIAHKANAFSQRVFNNPLQGLSNADIDAELTVSYLVNSLGVDDKKRNSWAL